MQVFRSKPEFFRFWHEDTFWNKPITWKTMEEAMGSDFGGLVVMRYQGAQKGGQTPFYYDLRLADLPARMKTAVEAGHSPEDFNFAEQLGGVTIHGEIRMLDGELTLFYSEEDKIFREALRSSGKEVSGLKARTVLEKLLCPNDLELLYLALDRYPDHVVEFSGFKKPTGIVPGSRMVIWEVRLY